MQKLYYILIILLIRHISFAQSVKFDYDNAGNRIRRSHESGQLPVTLISFTATKISGDQEGATALLNWQTASATNADRFDVERSQNGIVLWNYVNLSELLTKVESVDVMEEMISTIHNGTAVAWQHVNMLESMILVSY